eukprot:TRINITY_DN3962_c0_g1_i2.p1 TRINITY_DN3962_c0_g1~~TRINITY_DN3962_c0_g1_i2.p1  ORF type:complete len:378 (+),score=75.77 TRINITY_DN3962_c0_g1_i2:57-1136(+)
MVASGGGLGALTVACLAAALGVGTWHFPRSTARDQVAAEEQQDQEEVQGLTAPLNESWSLQRNVHTHACQNDSELMYAAVKGDERASQLESLAAIAALILDALFFLLLRPLWSCLRRERPAESAETKQKHGKEELPMDALHNLPTPARQAEEGKRSLRLSREEVRKKMAGLRDRCDVIEGEQEFVATDAKSTDSRYAHQLTELDAAGKRVTLMDSRDVRQKMAGLRERCEVIEGAQDFIATDAKSSDSCSAIPFTESVASDEHIAPKRKMRGASEIREKMAALREQCEGLGENEQSFITTDAKCSDRTDSGRDEVALSDEGATRRRALRSSEEIQRKMAEINEQCATLGEGDGRVVLQR